MLPFATIYVYTYVYAAILKCADTISQRNSGLETSISLGKVGGMDESESDKPLEISFCGAGFLAIYHVGVLKCIQVCRRQFRAFQ